MGPMKYETGTVFRCLYCMVAVGEKKEGNSGDLFVKMPEFLKTEMKRENKITTMILTQDDIISMTN